MTAHAKDRPWRVLQQQSWCDDVEVCSHRTELVAEICARHQQWRSNRELPTRYTVRRRQES